MSIDLEQIQTLLVERWKDSFRGVMETMAGIKPEMPPSAAPEEEETAGMLWWRQQLDGVAGSGVWLGSPSHTWMRIGQLVLSGAGIEAASEADVRDSYFEVLKQAFIVLARALSSDLEQEVSCAAGREEEPPPNAAGSWIGVRPPRETLPPFQIHFSCELLEAMLRRAQRGEPVETAPPAEPAAAAEFSEDDPELSPRARRTLDVLLDVEMPVHVSFGKTRVRMQEVLKFVNGSVIELDRSISEPVEILVNNCVIARGTVVVVNGNYGVQINEVASRRERLQQSRRFLLPARVAVV